jgi:Domain of unknown function (DUF4167)
MRNGQNKRMRGRNRKGQNPLTRVYESNGPDVKIRGTPNHVAEKYIQLARDATASGDPVAAENYFQHAEHYFRLIAAAQEQFRQSNPYFRHETEPRDDSFDGGDEDSAGHPTGDMPYGREQQPYPPRESQPYHREQQPYPPREPQPYGGGRPQPHVPQARPEGGGDPGLPAFITGGAQPQPQPQPNYQGYGHGQNGFDGQPDRFPLHRRRRRRHGGPRGDMNPHHGGGGGHEEAAPPPSPGEPTQE